MPNFGQFLILPLSNSHKRLDLKEKATDFQVAIINGGGQDPIGLWILKKPVNTRICNKYEVRPD